ncbi:MAG TPA: DUF4334 domain-containing protein [Trebonia sp.]
MSWSAPDRAQTLHELEAGTTTEAALSFFDSLPAVTVPEMMGAWRGSELETGHQLHGLLAGLGWHGKRFEGADRVHPLVFAGPRGRFSVNPALVPVSLAVNYGWALRNPVILRLGRPALRLLRTSRPKARLRMTEYRGVLTGTMSYDAIAANDHFRKVDEETLLGAMDLRGLSSPFLFVLRRETRDDVTPRGRAGQAR